MRSCFCTTETNKPIAIKLFNTTQFISWLKNQKQHVQNTLAHNGFKPEPGNHTLLMDEYGFLEMVLFILDESHHPELVGLLPFKLPSNVYTLDTSLPDEWITQACINWGLGAYQFTRYKKSNRTPAQLLLNNKHVAHITNAVNATYLVRDLINTPPEDMTPQALAATAADLAKQYNAVFTQITGEELLEKNYPAIYHVGRASSNMPCLIDLRWGNEKSPKITLVGKGVCFDTGGLDLKTADGMRYMKKDMGGAAHVLGLARMIMEAQLPVQLRILIPAVENSISGNAYRPSDIITMRNGKTVEITNTDAEGRLVLADALTEACSDKPDLLIDFATLTGAARVAVGTEIAAFFTNQNNEVTQSLKAVAENHNDPVWELPLHKSYRKLLDSSIADLVNSASGPYAGATTAALFLNEFVDTNIAWFHFDIMAWNIATRPSHPEGGEAMGLRATFEFIQKFLF